MQQVADTQGRLALATRTAMQAIGEVALVASAYVAYAFARDFVYEDRVLPAFDNAWEIVGLERTLGIFKEPVLQDWLLSTSPEIVYLFNWFYILGYLPVVLTVAVFLYLTNRQTYRKYRTISLTTLAYRTDNLRALSVGSSSYDDRSGLCGYLLGPRSIGVSHYKRCHALQSLRGLSKPSLWSGLCRIAGVLAQQARHLESACPGISGIDVDGYRCHRKPLFRRCPRGDCSGRLSHLRQ